jgi:hypothetical protein
MMAICPIGMFQALSPIFALCTSRLKPVAVDPFWQYGIVSIVLVPWFAVEAWRAARALGDQIPRSSLTVTESLDGVKPSLFGLMQESRQPPLTLLFGLALVVTTPLWVAWAESEFGPWALLAGIIWWPIGSLSPIAYMIGMAQIDAEKHGEVVRTSALKALYQLGGFMGVMFVRRPFRGAGVPKDFPSGFPSAMVFIVIGVAVLLLTGRS